MLVSSILRSVFRITALSVALFCSTVSAASGFYRVDGKKVLNPAGEPVQLKGINLGNWFVPEGYMFLFDGGPQSGREIDAYFRELVGPEATDHFWQKWRDGYVTESDIRLISAAGFNSVRIPLHHALFVEGGAGYPLLDRAIGWCRKYKIGVVLDLHAAPGGQTGTNIDDSWGYPWLYRSPQAQQQTVDLWARLAKRYANEKTVIGYDLLNEPIPHYPALRSLEPHLYPLYERLSQAIRAVDANHILIYEGSRWASNFAVFAKPLDPNAIYSFHKYWTAPTAEVIQEYVDFSNRHNVPLWLGESGENTDEWIGKFTQTLNQASIGWCYWPYKKLAKTSAVVTVKPPQGWETIVEYSKVRHSVGDMEKLIPKRPALDLASKAMDDLLTAIQAEHCQINSGYLAALGLKTPAR